MHVVSANNIRDALPKAIKYLLQWGHQEKTRVGDALVCQTPVTIRYLYPKQHVLLSPVRDANPFFHLMEAMWMLAGRDDGAFLDHYIKDFSKQFGIKGKIMDAYGYRWRHGASFDQLEEIITQLKRDPTTRQAVLQMWGAGRLDLVAPHAKPCNLVATFRVREDLLDMTVFNRSNDLIWGCCGANAVHFPILQEYIASKIGKQMGVYYQISTNLHLYMNHYKMLLDRTDVGEESNLYSVLWDRELYEETIPLVDDPDTFDEDLNLTMANIYDIHQGLEVYTGSLSNSFLRDTVLPMAMAHALYKRKKQDYALEVIHKVKAADWRRAGTEWLERHIK